MAFHEFIIKTDRSEHFRFDLELADHDIADLHAVGRAVPVGIFGIDMHGAVTFPDQGLADAAVTDDPGSHPDAYCMCIGAFEQTVGHRDPFARPGVFQFPGIGADRKEGT